MAGILPNEIEGPCAVEWCVARVTWRVRVACALGAEAETGEDLRPRHLASLSARESLAEIASPAEMAGDRVEIACARESLAVSRESSQLGSVSFGGHTSRLRGADREGRGPEEREAVVCGHACGIVVVLAGLECRAEAH
jgi:hypothetical protein